MPYCPECGDEIKDSSQNFCEKCGFPIPSSLKSKESTTEPIVQTSTVGRKESYAQSGGLFDINRNYYILKEKYWDWGSGDIYDENNEIIGKMKRIIFSIRRRVELQEVDGTIAATIHAKIVSARGAQDLKDPQGNLIARIKKKILTFFKNKFFLEAPDGTRWYEAIGDFFGFSFKVYDITTGKVVAEIEKADKWRDLFLTGLFDFKDTYALRILDNETDRRILVGFVLSIDNVLHDSPRGPLGGWVR
ncbi:MAG: LURP-one-related family protein [Candidatus Hodarchaeota archaeon]